MPQAATQQNTDMLLDNFPFVIADPLSQAIGAPSLTLPAQDSTTEASSVGVLQQLGAEELSVGFFLDTLLGAPSAESEAFPSTCPNPMPSGQSDKVHLHLGGGTLDAAAPVLATPLSAAPRLRGDSVDHCSVNNPAPDQHSEAMAHADAGLEALAQLLQGGGDQPGDNSGSGTGEPQPHHDQTTEGLDPLMDKGCVHQQQTQQTLERCFG